MSADTEPTQRVLINDIVLPPGDVAARMQVNAWRARESDPHGGAPGISSQASRQDDDPPYRGPIKARATDTSEVCFILGWLIGFGVGFAIAYATYAP